MSLPGAMSGRKFLKAFVTGKNFLPISNPQLNGMELSSIKGSNLLLAHATSKYVLYNSAYVTSIEIGSIVDRVKKQMLKDKQFINKMVEIKKLISKS